MLKNWNRMPFGHRPQDFSLSSLLKRWLWGELSPGWEQNFDHPPDKHRKGPVTRSCHWAYPEQKQRFLRVRENNHMDSFPEQGFLASGNI